MTEYNYWDSFLAAKRIDLDLAAWTRKSEVADYAKRRGISLDDAIRELVNEGLSHQ